MNTDHPFASISREDLIHLCIFLAGYQEKLQQLRGEVLSMGTTEEVRASPAWQKVAMSWPIIQGSQNQIHLVRIGELVYDPAAVSRAVKGAGKMAAHLIEESLSRYTVVGRTKGAFKISTTPGGKAIKHSAKKT